MRYHNVGHYYVYRFIKQRGLVGKSNVQNRRTGQPAEPTMGWVSSKRATGGRRGGAWSIESVEQKEKRNHLVKGGWSPIYVMGGALLDVPHHASNSQAFLTQVA